MPAKFEKNIVFVHIPKAGGTSVRAYISNQVERKYIFPEGKLHHFPRFEKLGSDKPMLFMSHLGYDFVKDANADAFVLLRHPIDRVLSVYSYVMNPGNNTPLIGKRFVQNMSLSDFLTSDQPEIRMNIDNAQTWQVASGYSARHRELRLKNGATLQRIAVQASNNLSNASVVGVLERLDRFYEGISGYFGTKSSGAAASVRKNVSESRIQWGDLSSKEKKLVENCVTEEWDLYEKAQSA